MRITYHGSIFLSRGNISSNGFVTFQIETGYYKNVGGKEKSQDRGRTHGFTASYKKAYVTLTADSKSIEFFDSLS